MTGGDNNVSNVKMHSSQSDGHPTKRKKLTGPDCSLMSITNRWFGQGEDPQLIQRGTAQISRMARFPLTRTDNKPRLKKAGMATAATTPKEEAEKGMKMKAGGGGGGESQGGGR